MKRSIVQTLSAALFASVFTVITTAAIGPSIALAGSDKIPTLDVRPVCRGIAFNRRIRAWDKVGKPRPFNDALRPRRRFTSS
jgi:hypothetical protein